MHVNGGFSKISIRNNQKLKGELYYGNEEKFNTGLEMLLDCVALFMEALKGEDTKLTGEKMKKCLILGDKIDQSSIIYKSDSKEQWTRACKCLLTNI